MTAFWHTALRKNMKYRNSIFVFAFKDTLIFMATFYSSKQYDFINYEGLTLYVQTKSQ
jgi:hypothetical protein